MNDLRVGIGTDRHPFVEGRKLILAGVEINSSVGLLGHSDGDALCHSLIDSLLGAVCLGDIGQYFPETDEWKDASSIFLLEKIIDMIRDQGWEVVNIDTIVTCGRIRLSDYRDDMIKNLSKIMNIPEQRISVKFKSANGLGFESQDGVSVLTICLLRGPSSRNS
ncbi:MULTISPECIES: 2-C-methyl-D-erythritol 2,4-cyclodiphosphate synthase [Pseudothermotoga]|jgi:2-C-methyl-D-erythritol 2,4-cyclodiphosphate synthase|uniref:2-C-methyl-D-erythritol 2,4-cyclodiphosphate synthase n=1 Tax=Pseudothermotoga lettingae (strain ATCC BAA-301 / DSM 14385 / NBRC 107922 / TMO) TaxID=416591 RepID=A8F4L5_PSELT|nr:MULTISPECIES: 2-C-methyl-D-erythritol 2,4-cyclodiphosphate synthase [Pseudothermotoga]ABV33099.1 2C-methyl-D-erythritol 2,4-cyclodiphosphate synthase [Pseudothermotoga lettingae TMO]KUK20228.1 MAG: 2-C-methyl-D-erythritol 2,4-cyclodiphosphate synthase [Pseudothermotoga lettingae]MDI3494316.1 2-C-methyl-D-erythritol 2,4-cyclodiphosphate synthase [Pseudothermotoga sp.]GLI47900.1 2-C-methyl-D-erythritol 2,4-cyclodiphosphate synthase [Pseudothermotoga lettingae TMO]HBJ81255.1 2-C-methyl-D-eryth